MRYYVFPQVNYASYSDIIINGYLYKLNTSNNNNFYHGTNNNQNLIGVVLRTGGRYTEYVYSTSSDNTYVWAEVRGGTVNLVHEAFEDLGNGIFRHATIPSTQSNVVYTVEVLSSLVECDNVALNYFGIGTLYPITYSYTNSTTSGPSGAAAGDTVVVSAIPDVDYGITDPTTQIAVTNHESPLNFTWDASTNRITFIMPGPS